jgi:hypothetical protein
MGAYSDTPVFFGTVSMVTATLGASDPQPGARMTYDGNEYLFVQNGADTQALKGQYLCPLAGTSAFSMTVSGIASYEVPVGVVAHATITTGAYGWVLTKGYAPAYCSAAIAAGIGLETVANGLFGTAATGTVYGKLLSAVSAATNVTAGAFFNF